MWRTSCRTAVCTCSFFSICSAMSCMPSWHTSLAKRSASDLLAAGISALGPHLVQMALASSHASTITAAFLLAAGAALSASTGDTPAAVSGAATAAALASPELTVGTLDATTWVLEGDRRPSTASLVSSCGADRQVSRFWEHTLCQQRDRGQIMRPAQW